MLQKTENKDRFHNNFHVIIFLENILNFFYPIIVCYYHRKICCITNFYYIHILLTF